MKKTVITIARSYGSGGRTLGKLLAEQLGINCYDREILRMASDASGINEALFGQADERLKRSPLFGILKKNPYKGGVIPPENSDFVSDDNLFNYQAKVIKELAEQESCVIIGRCADYVLRDDPDVIKLYFCAPKRDCVARVMNQNGLSEKEAEKRMHLALEIDSIVSGLDAEEETFLRLRFQEKISITGIQSRMYLSRASVFRLQNKCFRHVLDILKNEGRERHGEY